MMKKFIILLTSWLMVISLAACGSSHCKECDEAVYKDGYCEYHYALNAAGDIVDGAADEILESVFGS